MPTKDFGPGATLLSGGFDIGSEAGRERVRLAIEMFGLAFFESDMATGKVVMTPNAFAMFGLPVPPAMPVDRSCFWDCYHPDDKGWARARFESDLRGERGQDSYCERVRIIRRTDAQIRWIEFSGRMFGPPGARTHIVGMLRDVTGQVEVEERQQLLMREVDHRARNTLAVVQALVRLTQGVTVADYKSNLEGRVLSLSRTQSLLSEKPGGITDVAKIIDNELAAYRDRVTVAVGDAPPLGKAAVQPVAMILYELATNAAKHGALSVPSGRVQVALGHQDGAVAFAWTERGGPQVAAPPSRSGTGMAVVRAQARRLGGALDYRWDRDGLDVEARFPIARWTA